MNMVKLLDGSMVPSDSEAWRHECEARAIAELPTLADRRAWLESMGLKRGAEAVNRLRATMQLLWKAGKP